MVFDQRQRFSQKAMPRPFEVRDQLFHRSCAQFSIDLDSKSETSLRCPLRQTLPIFKQPVTYYPKQRDEVKPQVTNTNNPVVTSTSTTSGGKPSEKTKPRQLFWEKRFQNMRPTDIDGQPFENFKLPPPIQGLSTLKTSFKSKSLFFFFFLGVGLNMSPETTMISLATSLHLYGNSRALFGQNNHFQKYPTSYIQRDQPLIEVHSLSLFLLVSRNILAFFSMSPSLMNTSVRKKKK